MTQSEPNRTARWDEVRRLRRERPRSLLARLSAGAIAGFAAYAWLGGDVALTDLFSPRRLENLRRFLAEDATPRPLRATGFSWTGLVEWAGELFVDPGASAALATLWIAVLAIVLAALLAAVLAPFGARTLMTNSPYQVGRHRSGISRLPWRVVYGAVRTLFILMRAVPEYVLAFLLLAIFGPNAWPAVLALAIHNAGILGRLTSESFENLDAAPMRALRMLGADRPQIAWTALRPLALSRFLLFFFYRFETCVREATVLGMLGVLSLGYWIQDARARQLYDELLFLVALGAGLVLLADLLSHVARAWVRRAA